MIDVVLAERLALAGLLWEPDRGDYFVLPNRDMDEQVFVLSDMTIEVHQFPAGEVLGFNGTVEWALDSVERHEALWLPREDQLRERLGSDFAALTRNAAGYEVRLVDGSSFAAEKSEEAYGQALLATLLAAEAQRPAVP